MVLLTHCSSTEQSESDEHCSIQGPASLDSLLSLFGIFRPLVTGDEHIFSTRKNLHLNNENLKLRFKCRKIFIHIFDHCDSLSLRNIFFGRDFLKI